ncbi:hypothetical protein FRC08_000902 [Ceratobasidium sp. 394]|nr:hypothetical protein FRC08_000902 [Ceratobasidium sp. 394]
MIIVLACTVSTHRPHYDLGSNQCYWYAGVVWEITCALDDPSKPIPYSDLKGTNAGLLWLTIRPDVSEYDDAKALAPKYERDWAAFWEEVKERQGHGMPARIRESEKMVQVEVEARAAAEKRVQEEAKARATVENRMQEETKARVSAEEKARIAEKKLEIARELIETMKKKLSSGQLAHWPHAHSVCTTF